MKKLITYPLITIALTMMIMIGGCTKVNNSNPQALVGLHFHTYIDTNLVDPFLYPTQWFADSLGRLEHLSSAQFYVTNLSFRNKSSQAWYTIPGSVFLKRISNEIYPVGNIPAGTYDAIGFTIGLGNSLNSQPPSAFSTAAGADTVLSATEQSTMWGSVMTGMTGTPSGYTFINVVGYDSADHLPFSYQIGGYGDTVQITLPYPAGFTIGANEPSVLQLVHVIADYGKLLQTIRPMTPSNTNSTFYGPNPVPANSTLNNIVNMFRYECPIPNGDC